MIATAREKMAKRIMPSEFVTMDEFHAQTQVSYNWVSRCVYNLKRLLDQSLPGMDTAVHDQLLLHQFFGRPASSRSELLVRRKHLMLRLNVHPSHDN